MLGFEKKFITKFWENIFVVILHLFLTNIVSFIVFLWHYY